MATKEYPGTDGLHVGEMAQELASYDVYMGAPILILENTTPMERERFNFGQLMVAAERRIVAEYQQMAEEDPEAVRKAYNQLVGETNDAL